MSTLIVKTSLVSYPTLPILIPTPITPALGYTIYVPPGGTVRMQTSPAIALADISEGKEDQFSFFNYVWTQNGHIRSTTDTLVLDNLSNNDGGNYLVTATNVIIPSFVLTYSFVVNLLPTAVIYNEETIVPCGGSLLISDPENPGTLSGANAQCACYTYSWLLPNGVIIDQQTIDILWDLEETIR